VNWREKLRQRIIIAEFAFFDCKGIFLKLIGYDFGSNTRSLQTGLNAL